MDVTTTGLEEHLRDVFLNREIIDGLSIRTGKGIEGPMPYLLLEHKRAYHKIPFISEYHSAKDLEMDSAFMLPGLEAYADNFSYESRIVCLSRMSAASKRDLDSIALYSARAGIYQVEDPLQQVNNGLILTYKSLGLMNALWFALNSLSAISSKNIIQFAALSDDIGVSLKLAKLSGFFRALRRISEPVVGESDRLVSRISERYFSGDEVFTDYDPKTYEDLN